MNKTKRNFTITGILFLLFVFFTFMITKIDVRPIGPENSTVGFASINQFIFELSGTSSLWYNITDWLGIIIILFALGFALLGLFQLIKRKSLFKIDKSILLLGVFYVVIIAFYILFENIIINYRPVLMDGVLEASYPSSHTMIAICIMSTAIIQFHELFPERKKLLTLLDILSVFIILTTIIGRLLSGVHWFTDIIAGILLSSALIMLYYSILKYIKNYK